MRCPKCDRELSFWPLERGDLCAPRDWAYCIRPVGEGTMIRKDCWVCKAVFRADAWAKPSVLDLLDEHYAMFHPDFGNNYGRSGLR